MRTILMVLAASFWFACLAGCSSESDPKDEPMATPEALSEKPGVSAEEASAATDKAPSRTEGTSVEAVRAAIRKLIPEAAGISNEEYERWQKAPGAPSIKKFEKKPVSLAILGSVIIPPCEGFTDIFEARQEELSFGGGYPDGRKFAPEIERSLESGYRTLLQPDRITDVTCDVQGQSATGTVSFEVPDFYRGKFEYTAEYENGGWRITEFRLPAHHYRFIRGEGDQWEWFDFFGKKDDFERIPTRQPVTGTVLFQGQPLGGAELSFYHRKVPTAFWHQRVDVDAEGNFTAKYPAGRYAVKIECREPSVNPNNARYRDASKAIVEIKEGDNHVVLDLVPKEGEE